MKYIFVLSSLCFATLVVSAEQAEPSSAFVNEFSLGCKDSFGKYAKTEGKPLASPEKIHQFCECTAKKTLALESNEVWEKVAAKTLPQNEQQALVKKLTGAADSIRAQCNHFLIE